MFVMKVRIVLAWTESAKYVIKEPKATQRDHCFDAILDGGGSDIDNAKEARPTGA